MANFKNSIIIGAGQWVLNQYMPALKPYIDRGECDVHIVYRLPDPKGDAIIKESNATVLRNVRQFRAWGARCYNIKTKKADIVRIKNFLPDAVFVVTPGFTHCAVVKEWLGSAYSIYVEKPFDTDPEKIRKLRTDSNYRDNEVWGFDHYLARANQFHQMRESLHFDERMEEVIHEFRFHMLESKDREMVERAPSIQDGMILDMASHTPALVLPFGDPNTIRFNAVKAGIYERNSAKGIKSSGVRIMRSRMETFAEIKFTFKSIYGDEVDATACVGKAVGEADEKYVEVVGGKNKNRRFRLDLSDYFVDFTSTENGEEETQVITSLFAKPVHLLVREVMAGRAGDTVATFRSEVAQDIIARLNEWRKPILDYINQSKRNRLGVYPGGTPLDGILNQLKPL